MVFGVGEFFTCYILFCFLSVIFFSGYISVTVLLIITTLFYLRLKWYNSYWKRNGLQGPELNLIFGSSLDLRRGCHTVDIENFKKFGSTYGTVSLGRLELVTQDLNLMRQIFVKEFNNFPERYRTTFINTKQPESIMQNNLVNIQGDDWKRVRLVCTPAFTLAKIKKLVPLFLDSVKNLAINIDEKYVKKSKPMPIKDAIGRMALDVIARSGFAMNIDSFNDDSPFIYHSNEIMDFDISGLLSLFIVSFPNFSKLIQRFFDYEFGITDHHKFFKNVLEEMYENRKATSTNYNDIMEILMNVTKENFTEFNNKEDDDIVFEDSHSKLAENLRKQGISKIELISQCFVLLMAGFETSATTMHFTLYILSKMPEIQDKLRYEVESVLKDDKDITYEHVQKMKYMTQIINETLRMYSPAPRTNRVCTKKTKLNDIQLYPGMIVTIPIFAIHYNPEIYPNPEVFDPERFSPEEKAKRNPLTFLPFGAGPRNCIGMKFAELEMKIVLAFLIRNYRFEPPNDGPELPLKITTTGLTRPIKTLCTIPIKIRNF